MGRTGGGLGWIPIIRLGLVQTALGSIVVLTTSTLNRVMVVELGLAAMIPGILVGVHYAVQMLRPVWGHGSDIGGRRTPWIIGGVGLLAAGATGAALATGIMAHSFTLGLILALFDFVLIGIGVGAAGTSLLALLASSVRAERRPAAATIVWLMMILGMAVTATLAGSFLDPFSPARLLAVTAIVGSAALAVTALAVFGVEDRAARVAPPRTAGALPAAPFMVSLRDAWGDPHARLFTIFVFVSMLAYSAQDLILEPFAGLVFAMTPGETTKLSGLQHGGVFAGMVLTGLVGSLLSGRFPGVLRLLAVAGCLASGATLAGIVMSASMPALWPLEANVAALGFANGVFAVAAIASMMALAGAAGRERTGMRMGLWGAAQAIAFGIGGFAGTVAVDAARLAGLEPAAAYATVFGLEAVVFVAAAMLAMRIAVVPRAPRVATTPALQPAE
jgi:MFS transporter, BCD family, chlorophyll transporter